MLAEYVVLSEEAVVHIPRHPALCRGDRLASDNRPSPSVGDTVLVYGCGGVSIFAWQFAKLVGAQPIATTSTAEKAALGKLVNYTEIPDRDVKARELTEGLRRLRGVAAARIGRVALKRDQKYIGAASQNS